ncbi:MAG: hypothetical protein K2H01_11950 [Ruminococcus sp.]|nr:hypothetical protein [Ruminococcus sp.]
MDNEVFITLQTTNKDFYRLNTIKQFVFKKDKYTPYTELSVTIADIENAIDPKSVFYRIQLSVNRSIIHIGLIDSSDYSIENGVSVINIRSRGYTSLLLNNQMIPGVHSNMSLDKLMTSYYDFPYNIQWEQDSTICNYIYVKEHRSMWDSVINLGYKLYGTYPYIKGPNKIILKPHSNPAIQTFEKDRIIKYGAAINTTGILSHLHMQDIEGNYGTYNLENSNAEDLMIVRHKQIAFDKQYLNEPNQSMNLMFALASKRWKTKYVTIDGCSYLDINDMVGAEGFFDAERVCGVLISGNSHGINSTYYIYDDDFSTAK